MTNPRAKVSVTHRVHMADRSGVLELSDRITQYKAIAEDPRIARVLAPLVIKMMASMFEVFPRATPQGKMLERAKCDEEAFYLAIAITHAVAFIWDDAAAGDEWSPQQ
jgi:hypothetical protein